MLWFAILSIASTVVSGLQNSPRGSPADDLLAMASRARERGVAVPLMGVHDALSANILLQSHRASSADEQDLALFVSGFGVSAARLGQPDAGILTRSDLEDTVRNVALQSTAVPVVADGDTGFGGSANLRQTIRRMAAVGAAALSIEDQAFPKRCTYVAGKGIGVIDREEARRRIRAAVAARDEAFETDGNRILLIGRTDCRMALGLEEAIARCSIFEELGADIVYAENLQSDEEYAALRLEVSTPMILAQVQTMGTGPAAASPRTTSEIGALGYELGLWGISGLQAAVAAMRSAADEVFAKGGGGPVSVTPLATLEEVKKVVGFDDLDAFDAEYPCT